MAACTLRVGTASSAATPAASGAFTPAVGDLIVVLAQTSGQNNATCTCTSSIGGFTYTRINGAAYGTNSHRCYLFVSDALVSSATSQTVTIAPSVAANGSTIFVFSVSGMTQVGSAAVLQSAVQQNGAAAATPAPAFAAAALTSNPTLGIVGNLSNPAGMTAPSGWTEPAGGDLGYTSPLAGGEVVFRDSGFTGTTVTWGSTSASVFGAIIVELDASGAATAIRDIIGRGVIPFAR